MTCHVLIVGLASPTGRAAGRSWRVAADLVSSRLAVRFGDAVTVEDAELLAPG